MRKMLRFLGPKQLDCRKSQYSRMAQRPHRGAAEPGLTASLRQDELADLLAYLTSLGRRE